MKTLHLTLKKKWFDLILSGEKTIEYREMKPFWEKRLVGKQYNVVKFRNGYSPDSPTVTVEFKGLSEGLFVSELNAKCYGIHLGKIIRHTPKMS